MPRTLAALVPVLFASIAFATTSHALQSCSAMNNAGQSCSVSCGAGETAVCKAKPSYVSCDCNGGATAPPADLDLSGTGSGGTVRIEAYDVSCEVLPCTPALVGGIDVPVTPGMSPADFAQDAVTAFGPVLGATCSAFVRSATSDGIRLWCGSFHPSYRICDSALGSCPLDLTQGTGTSGDMGVDLAGFSFDSPAPPLLVPALGVLGISVLFGAVAWTTRSRLGTSH